MICGRNDWDDALEEAYVRAVLEGRVVPPAPQPRPALEDYGRSFTFSMEDLC